MLLRVPLALVAFALLASIVSCEDKQEEQPDDLTGNETAYPLYAGVAFGYDGTLTIKERRDGYAQLVIHLEGTSGALQFPAHLHFGSYSEGAAMAALLEPVQAATGRSETLLTALMNEEPITYAQLLQFDGHIKVHQDDNLNKGVILSYGNMGINDSGPANGRISACFSPIF
jgi:hypothetical protein